MAAQKCIGIYGRSLFGLAVEATLTEQTNFPVMPISCEADLMDTLDIALLVVEVHDFASLPSPSPPIPVLVLDVPNGRITIIQQEQRPINNMNDLVKIVICLTGTNPFVTNLL